MRRRIWILLTMGGMCFAGVSTLASYGFDMKGILRTLTEEPKRADPSKSQTTSTLVTQDEQYRGRAQEMQPDISLPPPPNAPEAAPDIQEAPESQVGSLITGLEKIASISSTEQMDDSIPTEAYRPANSAQKVRWMPPPPGCG